MIGSLRRQIAGLHGVRPQRVQVFEDDAALYEARRAARMKVEGKRRRAARRPPLRLWWAQATPVERFTRVVWWSMCGVAGFGFGAVAMAFLWFGFGP